MTDTVALTFVAPVKLLDEVAARLSELDGTDALIGGDSVRSRREASAERAKLTKELLFLAHELEKARILVLDEYHRVSNAAKQAESAA